MSALLDHIQTQAGRAALLARIIALLNTAITHPELRDLCMQLVDAGQKIASDLEDKLQDVNLPKGDAA
jgi:hypothetical protein